MLNYQNSRNRDSLDNCCTGSGRNCGNLPCNNLFLLCAGPRGQTQISNRECPFGLYNFTRNDDDITSNEVPNPFVFHGRQGAPVSFFSLFSCFYYMYTKQTSIQTNLLSFVFRKNWSLLLRLTTLIRPLEQDHCTSRFIWAVWTFKAIKYYFH